MVSAFELKELTLFCVLIWTVSSLFPAYSQEINATMLVDKNMSMYAINASQPWDIPNWSTMIVEVAVGVVITALIFIKTKQTNDSMQRMVEKIKDTTTGINTTTTEMDKVVKKIGATIEGNRNYRAA
jgi:hypothetical protein